MGEQALGASPTQHSWDLTRGAGQGKVRGDGNTGAVGPGVQTGTLLARSLERDTKPVSVGERTEGADTMAFKFLVPTVLLRQHLSPLGEFYETSIYAIFIFK